ncbi:hypothetical protein GCM10010270_79680 [Streptomyces violaceus]|nr:hypothetical protein GCM10010270_79680 [Streptomyces janthinus]
MLRGIRRGLGFPAFSLLAAGGRWLLPVALGLDSPRFLASPTPAPGSPAPPGRAEDWAAAEFGSSEDGRRETTATERMQRYHPA